MSENKNSIDITYDLVENFGLIDAEDDQNFLEWNFMQGSKKIRELSRQLRTFFNYKWVIIHQRYSKSLEFNDIQKKNELEKQKNELTSLFTNFVSLIKNIRADEEDLGDKITNLMKIAYFKKNSHEIITLKKIKKLNAEIWIKLHIISEFENINLRLLNAILRIAEILCKVEVAFYKPFSTFYLELRISYLHLEKEVLMILLSKKESLTEKNKKVQISEWL